MKEIVYRSPSKLAAWAATLAGASAVAEAVAALVDVYQLALLNVYRFGGTVPVAVLEAQDLRERIVSGLAFGLEIAAMVMLLIWLYRISRNTWAFGIEDLRYTPGWSVGWFFVPIAGLVMPYNVFHELWKANGPRTDILWRKNRVSHLLGFWWATCIASAVIHYDPLTVALGSRSLRRLDLRIFSNWVDSLWSFYCGRLLVDVVWMAGSVLAVAVILRLTALQMRRHEAVGDVAAETSDGLIGRPFPAWRHGLANE
jgi:hypothetical protein